MDVFERTLLLKVLPPVVGIVAILLASRRFIPDWKSALGLKLPRAAHVMLWLGIWAIWLVLSELLINALGLEQAKKWPDQPALVVGMRILAIGLLGPVVEELLMRGLIFSRLSRTKVGVVGAILITSAAWAGIHVQYDWKSNLMLFSDGLLFGVARHKTQSIVVPILLHAIGNSISIYQSLS